MTRRWANFGLVLLFGFIALADILPFISNALIYPGRDSGVFLYVGQQILLGKVPYRDVWDHKPPLIYYVDALGLWLAHGQIAGATVLEYLGLWGSACLSWLASRHVFGPLPAICGTLAWLVSLPLVYESGNLTEIVALPLLFGALFLFFTVAPDRSLRWRAVGLGVCCGLSCLCQQNLIGLYIALTPAILMRCMLRQVPLAVALRDVVVMWGIAVAEIGVVIWYFAAAGALPRAWSAVVVFNEVYASATPTVRLTDMLHGLYLLSRTGLVAVAAIGWCVCVLLWWRRGIARRSTAVLTFVVIDSVVELIAVTLPGHDSPHYYAAWFPVISVLVSGAAYALYHGIRPGWLRYSVVVFITLDVWFMLLSLHTYPDSFSALLCCPLLVMAILYLLPRLVTTGQANRGLPRTGRVPIMLVVLGLCIVTIGRSWAAIESKGAATTSPAVHLVMTATSPDDYVLMWGAESSMYVVTHRLAPSRFVYQYPLYTSGYQTHSMIADFLADLRRHPPALVIDASSTDGQVPSLDPTTRRTWVTKHVTVSIGPLAPVFTYIAQHYTKEGVYGGWTAYRPEHF